MAGLDQIEAPCACCGDECACGAAVTELPIACTLEASEQENRARAWHALIEKSAVDAKLTERGASLRLRRDSEEELRALIAAESRCCAFLRFDLREESGEVRLSVEGPADARAVIEALFALAD